MASPSALNPWAHRCAFVITPDSMLKYNDAVKLSRPCHLTGRGCQLHHSLGGKVPRPRPLSKAGSRKLKRHEKRKKIARKRSVAEKYPILRKNGVRPHRSVCPSCPANVLRKPFEKRCRNTRPATRQLVRHIGCALQLSVSRVTGNIRTAAESGAALMHRRIGFHPASECGSS